MDGASMHRRQGREASAGAAWIASWLVFARVAARSFLAFLPFMLITWALRTIAEPTWHGLAGSIVERASVTLAIDLAVSAGRTWCFLHVLATMETALRGTRPHPPGATGRTLKIALVCLNLGTTTTVPAILMAGSSLLVSFTSVCQFIVHFVYFTAYHVHFAMPDLGIKATFKVAGENTGVNAWKVLLLIIVNATCAQLPATIVHVATSGSLLVDQSAAWFFTRGFVVTLIQAVLAGIVPGTMLVLDYAMGVATKRIPPGSLPPLLAGLAGDRDDQEGTGDLESRGKEARDFDLAANALCPECRAPVPPYASACLACGFPVYRCPRCTSIFDDEDGTCPACGERVPDDR